MTRDELIEKMQSAIAGPDSAYEGMSRALNVVLDEVLKDQLFHREGGDHVDIINVELAHRRARYAKVKTAEERVTVIARRSEGLLEHHVCLDGTTHYKFGDQLSAEIYKRGLIAQLKEGK